MARVQRRVRRLLFVLLPLVAILFVYLLWPLSSRRWDIAEADDGLARKDEYLAAERAVARRAGLPGTNPRGLRPPRVILIVADDLALVDVSRYGEPLGASPVATPAIDSIGADGATFTSATATATICAPSRASLLTGRYQQRYGFELQPHTRYARNRLEYLAFRYLIDTDPMRPIAPAAIPRRAAVERQGLPASEITLAELLGARGYRTAVFGKWHLGYAEAFSPLRRGFDEHYGFYEAFSLYAPRGTPGIVDTRIDDFSDNHMWSQGRRGASAIVHNDDVVTDDEYLTFRFAELAADYIEQHAEEPFFLYLPFSAPHTPLQAPEAYVEALGHIDDPVRRTYAAMIAALDDAVDTVLDAVDDAGIREETVIVFTSDNGGTSYLGVTDNGPLAGGKFTNFQGGMAVPLMVRYPGVIPSDTVYREPVSLLDVFATVEAATRPDVSAGPEAVRAAPFRPSGLELDGVDLVPHLLGERAGPPHDALYWRSMYNKAVRAGPYKLIVTTDGSPAVPDGEARYELYNLDLDPEEHTDIAADHPGVVMDLLCRLNAWEASVSEPAWPPVMHFWHTIHGRRRWFAI